MQDIPATIRSHCNNCGGERNHAVLHREQTSWDEDLGHGNSIYGSDTYLLVKCAGCDAICLRHESFFSENYDDNPTVSYYPPAISRRMPAWASDLKWHWGGPELKAIGNLLREIYSALQNGSRQLAAIGVRAVIEVVMIEKVGDNGSIGANVKKFLDEGFVAKFWEPLFKDVMIEAGHAAMHRNYDPDESDLLVLMDMMESLLETIYVHPAKAKKLGEKLPPRRQRAPATKNKA